MINRKIEKYNEFLENRLNEKGEELIDIATSGVNTILGKLQKDPSLFLKALSAAIEKSEGLPDSLNDEFEETAEKQLKSIDNLYDVAPKLHGNEKKAEAAFNKRSDGEKEAEEKIAQIQAETTSVMKPDFTKMGNWRFDTSDWTKYKRETYINLLKDKKLISHINLKTWNILGLRNSINKRRSVPNGFIDAMVLLPPEGSNRNPEIFQCTTFPGPAFRVAPYRAWWISRQYKWLGVNPAKEGVAIMQPGIYQFRVSGKVLRPTNGVDVQRYSIVQNPIQAVDFNSYSPGKPEKKNHSILIHSAKGADRVDNWSSGCQVLKNGADLDKIIKTVASEVNGKINYILINT